MKILMILSLLVLGLPCFALADGIEVQKLESEYKLSAFAFHDPSSKFVDLSITFAKAGYAFDPNNKGGISYILALLVEGGFFNKNRDSKQFDEFIRMHDISLGTNVDKDDLTITISSWADNLEHMFQLLQDIFMNENIDDKGFKHVKDFMFMEEAKRKEEPLKVAYDKLYKVIYADHPYSNPPWGTKKSIGNIAGTDVVNYAKKVFTRVNMNIALAGGFDKSELIRCLDQYLSDLPLTSVVPDLPKVKPNVFDRSKNTTINMQMPNKLLVFAHEAAAPSDKDHYNTLILNYILGGDGLSSLLAQEVRVKRAMTYGIRTSLVDSRCSSMIVGSVFTAVDKLDSLVNAVELVIAGVKKSAVTKEVFDKAKKSLVDRYYLTLTDNAKIAGTINYFQLWSNDKDQINLHARNIANVSYEAFLDFLKGNKSVDAAGMVYIRVEDDTAKPLTTAAPVNATNN